MHGRSLTRFLSLAFLSVMTLCAATLARAQCSSPPPSLRVEPDSVRAVLSGKKLAIAVKAADGAQLDRVEIRVRDQPALAIPRAALPSPAANGWTDLKVTYVVGADEPGALRLPPADTFGLKVTVTDSKGCSQAEEVRIQTKSPRAFAVVVGINDYPKAGASLRFARRDAERMVQHLLVNFPELDPDNVFLLTDPWTDTAREDPFKDMRDVAERKSIIRALAEVIRRIDSRGTFIFYFSGHGFTTTEDTFLSTHYLLARDSSPLFDDELLAMSDIVDRMVKAPGEQKILILDACFSERVATGGARDALFRDGRGLGGPVDNRGIEAFVRNKKVYVMTSSTDDELSYEIADLDNGQGHGIFTYYLLRSAEDPARLTDSVTVGEAFAFAADTVERELPRKVAGKTQRPNHWVFGRSEQLIWLQRR